MKARQITPNVDWVGAVDWDAGPIRCAHPAARPHQLQRVPGPRQRKDRFIDTVDPTLLERAVPAPG